MTLDLKVDGQSEDRAETYAQGILGTPEDRPDGHAKVSGAATYAADDLPEGCVFGMLVRAPGHGGVTVLNEDEVRGTAGVLAVIRDPRMIRNAAQGTANAAPVQGVDQADYIGQPVALVVAETAEAAQHAAQSLRLRTDGEAGPVNPDDVEAEGEPDTMGDLDAAMADAAHALDVVYTTPSMTSAPMEPHAAVAWWEGDRLTVRSALQMLKYNRNELADSLGIDPEHVRLLAPFVGGGFGSKLGISADAVAAAIAAQELGRPVRVVQHRRQVFETVTRRSETRQRIRLAADDRGRLTGIGHESLVSNLPDEAFSEPVSQATYFAYAGAHRVIGERLARLNRPASGSVRAPGEAVGVTTFECAMDELASEVGIDPVELRLRNIPDKDPHSGLPFSSHTLARSLNEGAARFGWADRPSSPRARREGEWWIGTGMAAAFRVNMMLEAEARITLTPDGAVVETDMTDIGTGTYAILTQIAGEALGLPVDRVDVRLGDTTYPPGSGSGGSFGAATTGNAVWLAAQEIRQAIAQRMNCAESDLTLKDGTAICGNTSRAVVELLDGASLEGHGHVTGGKAFQDVRQSTFGAHFAEVAVSDVTGEVRVRRMHGTFGAGRILNEKTARSQCHGGMTWGIGMALTENMVHDRRDGHIVNRDFAEYHMAVNADVPPLDVHFLDERDPWAGPLQAKGIGELGICGAGAAVINAIHHACGVRVRDLPATPDRVLAGLE
ncbi:Xanthine dehydrogenase molybdenum-binding subunit [Roseivivax jejudonensis]|uniref:Xanthine dehydrogenase molybdenum-binding subunit n=1 Tax=Roseivivax jejudonensis TaxID=1529041 RepID=A0A1X6ZZ89_9RHOB|nr:xanthine dehydrogenase family protein molybdopterin-binding subunit [Roseivivax jejudonensis]SLN65426.1 Xanthine dehydrogenase molybdenum-binding subunit [Roseivivax jejudonensis]